MKSSKTLFAALVLCALNLGLAQIVLAAEDFKGNWTIRHSNEPGQVHFGLIHHMHGGTSHHESDWPVSVLQGLDVSTRGKRDVQFTIARDAGKFDCQGYLNDGEGAGAFRFTLDARYVESMKALGFTGIDDEKQFAMAVHDVTLEFAKTMKNEKVSGLSTDMLIAFRIHGVSPQFIRETRKAGIKASADQLVAMRIHGVTPEYIADLKSRGMKNLTIDQMVNLRIHGID